MTVRSTIKRQLKVWTRNVHFSTSAFLFSLVLRLLRRYINIYWDWSSSGEGSVEVNMYNKILIHLSDLARWHWIDPRSFTCIKGKIRILKGDIKQDKSRFPTFAYESISYVPYLLELKEEMQSAVFVNKRLQYLLIWILYCSCSVAVLLAAKMFWVAPAQRKVARNNMKILP